MMKECIFYKSSEGLRFFCSMYPVSWLRAARLENAGDRDTGQLLFGTSRFPFQQWNDNCFFPSRWKYGSKERTINNLCQSGKNARQGILRVLNRFLSRR